MSVLEILELLVGYSPKLVSKDHWIFDHLSDEFTPDGIVSVLGVQISKDNLNINLLCKISGILTHDNKEYDTYSMKYIPIVKYGKIVNPKLQFEFSEESKQGLISIMKNNTEFDSILLNAIDNKEFDLTGLPILEYDQYIRTKEELADLIAESISLEIQTKVLSYLAKPKIVMNHGLPEIFNNDGSIKIPHSKPYVKKKPTLFSTKGIKMTIPSVNNVLNKKEHNKKLNVPESLLYESYNYYNNKLGVLLESEDLNNELYEIKGRLQNIRNEITFIKASHEHLHVKIANDGDIVKSNIIVEDTTQPVDIKFGELLNVDKESYDN